MKCKFFLMLCSVLLMCGFASAKAQKADLDNTAKTTARWYDGGHMQYCIKSDQGVGLWYYHSTAHVTAGWRFDRKHYLGVGTGCDWIDFDCDADPEQSNGEVTAIPLFVDYVHYSPFRHFEKHSFFWGVEAGGEVYTDQIAREDVSSRIFPFINPKVGIDLTVHGSFGVFAGTNWIIAESFTVLSINFGVRF